MLALRVYYRPSKCAELYQLQLILLELPLSMRGTPLAWLTRSVSKLIYMVPVPSPYR